MPRQQHAGRHSQCITESKKFVKPEIAGNPTVFLNEADLKKMAAPDGIGSDIRRTMTRLYTSFKTGI